MSCLTLKRGTNLRYEEHSPFYRLLATKYDPHQGLAALEILNANPGLALLGMAGSG